MGPIPPVVLPPLTAEYSSTLQPTGAQSPAAPSQYRFARAGDGKTRVDSGNMSVISNPAAAQTVVLDHVRKTATIQPAVLPALPNPAMPQMPGFAPPAPPGLPGQPHVPVHVEDLGKSVLQGHAVEGKRFVMPALAPPKPPALNMPAVPKPPALNMPAIPKTPGLNMPAVPKTPSDPGMPPVPGAPPLPGMPPPPGMPAAPGMPPAPALHPPSMAEVWSSPAMGLPMLTKMSGSFGQLTQVCHSVVPGEPHPSAFQIPKDYKVMGAGS